MGRSRITAGIMGEIEESGGKMPPKGTTRIPCGTIDEMGRQKRNRLSPKRNKPRK